MESLHCSRRQASVLFLLMRLLKEVGGSCCCLQQGEKDPAQGAEHENGIITIGNIRCHKEMEKLYQEGKKLKQVGTYLSKTKEMTINRRSKCCIC